MLSFEGSLTQYYDLKESQWIENTVQVWECSKIQARELYVQRQNITYENQLHYCFHFNWCQEESRDMRNGDLACALVSAITFSPIFYLIGLTLPYPSSLSFFFLITVLGLISLSWSFSSALFFHSQGLWWHPSFHGFTGQNPPASHP